MKFDISALIGGAEEALHFHFAARFFFHILLEGMADDTHFGIFGVTHCNFQRRFRRGGIFRRV